MTCEVAVSPCTMISGFSIATLKAVLSRGGAAATAGAAPAARPPGWRRRGTVVGLLDAFLALVVPRAENQLAVLGIKALFALPVHFAEVVVVTGDLIKDHLAVNQ